MLYSYSKMATTGKNLNPNSIQPFFVFTGSLEKTMRTFLLTIALSFFVIPIFSQEKIGIVDTDVLIQSLHDRYQTDLIYIQLEERFAKKAETMVKELQAYFQEVQRKIEGGCISREQMKELEKKVKERMDRVREFENFITVELPAKRSELDQILFAPIKAVTRRYAQDNQLSLVLYKNQVEFYAPELDITPDIQNQLEVVKFLDDQLSKWEIAIIEEGEQY